MSSKAKLHIKWIALTIAIVFYLFAGNNVAISKEITIKIASSDAILNLDYKGTNGEFSSTNIKAQVFKRVIEEKSYGRIKVKIYPLGQLGGEREMIEMLKNGSIQIYAGTAGPLSSFVPEFMATQIPYLFNDIYVANEVMNGPEGKAINELILKQANMRVLAWGYDGPYYNLMAVKKILSTPADIKGMKIRVMESPNMNEIFRILGATATPIPFPEVYTSLQQGVVDGLEWPTHLIRMMKLEELLKSVCLPNFFMGFSPIGINEKFYQSLSNQDKDLVKYASLEAMDAYKGLMIWNEGLINQYLREKGIAVNIPNQEEMKTWKKVLHQPMVRWTKNRIGAELVDKFLKASEETFNKLYAQ